MSQKTHSIFRHNSGKCGSIFSRPY